MFNTQILAGSSGQGGGIDQQSLKFNDDESQYLSWTPAAAGNRKTWTWSGWVKRGNIGINSFIFGCGSSGTNFAFIGFSSDNTIDIRDYQGSYTYSSKTSQVFRDTSAFYHLVLVADMNNATSADRIKLYVNGERVTSFNSAPSPTTKDLVTNSAIQHVIGSGYYNDGSGVNNYLDGYLSDIYFIDGQALDASSFGQFTNGYWKKKDYSGTYGTNGFHLTFQDDVVSEGFNAVTYRGNGGTQSVSGLGFAPDFVWLKGRSYAEHHHLYDTIRGATEVLYSNRTVAEASDTLGLTSFGSDGFSIGSRHEINNSGDSFVAWAWDAGSGSAASNTDGSITSTVKANPDYGFSVATYTGTGGTKTVGHGLGTTPAMVIVKSRSASSFWKVWHKDLTSGNNVLLNDTAAQASYNNRVGTNNTASVVEVIDGTSSVDNVNDSGGTYVMYSFAEVAGYSSIGTYSGTGSDNTVSGLGFRPAFVMTKRTDGVGYWTMMDNTRNPTGELKNRLWANASDAESVAATANYVETTSDGFTVIGGGGDTNASGGTYIYMAFADTREAAFWKDVSGQGNHWTPNNLDYRDSLIDSPANNFAVLNPLDNYNTGATLSEGNLKWTIGAADGASRSTYVMTAGKWYVEFLSNNDYIGVVSGNANITTVNGTQTVFYAQDGTKRVNGSSSSYGVSYSNGDIIGIALDLDASPQTVTFYKNNSSQGSLNLTDVGSEGYSVSCGSGSGSTNATANFGQDSTFSGATTAGGNTDANGIGDFAYAPPSGYLALCTANLPTPTIVDGSEHFNTVLWTGDGTASNAITGVGFEPDLVWTKARNYPRHHWWFDQVRGAEKWLQSSNTDPEADQDTGLMSFDADGFTYKYSSSQGFNTNNETYASWNWKAGGTAVSNTDGSITSQVSANTDAGFSVVSYTGTGANATVGHGLSSAPELIIVKNRSDGTKGWPTQVTALGNNYLELNTTNATFSGSTYFNNTAPTSSVFSVGTVGSTNASGNNLISYLFHSVEGYSKVGSYTGNGSNDGPFVYTGFRPAWVMIKRTDSTSNWHMVDSERDSYNMAVRQLQANLSNSEASVTYGWDILSNGFKLRTDGANYNASGGTYIYLAFAENPFKYANAR